MTIVMKMLMKMLVKMWSVFFLTAALFLRDSLAQECDTSGRCDKHERCPIWKEEGECITEKVYMMEHCPVSCNFRRSRVAEAVEGCKDQHDRCKVWADFGECEDNPYNMKKYCAKSCGACDPNKETDTPEEELVEDPTCEDKHAQCNFWSERGECTGNEKYMSENCPKSCGTCPLLKPSRTLQVQEVDIIEKSKEFGTLQKAEGQYKDVTIDRIEESIQYMKSQEVVTLSKEVRESCKVSWFGRFFN
jgi:hypothetical protein